MAQPAQDPDAIQNADDLPIGDFPSTNTMPVRDGVRPVSQDPKLFEDDGEF
jgi:hypothetical protein